MLSPLIRRYTWNSTWLYYIRIFIALCGTTALPWWLGDVKLTIPLTLGMVAAALTAGYLFIRSLVSATTAPAGRRSMV